MALRKLILRYGISHTQVFTTSRRCMSSTRYKGNYRFNRDAKEFNNTEEERIPGPLEKARAEKQHPSFITDEQPWLDLLLKNVSFGGKIYNKLGVMSQDHFIEKLFFTLASATEEQKEYLIKTCVLDLKDLEAEGLPMKRTESIVKNLLTPYKSFDKLKKEANILPAFEKVFSMPEVFPYLLESRMDFLVRFTINGETELIDRLCDTLFKYYENNEESILRQIEVQESLPGLLNNFVRFGSKSTRDRVLELCLNNEDITFGVTVKGYKYLVFRLCISTFSVDRENPLSIKLLNKVLSCDNPVSAAVVAKLLTIVDADLKGLVYNKISADFSNQLSNLKVFPYGYYSYLESIDNTQELENSLKIVLELLENEDNDIIRKRAVKCFTKVISNDGFSKLSQESMNNLRECFENNIDIFFSSAHSQEQLKEIIPHLASVDELNFLNSIRTGIINFVKNIDPADRKVVFALVAFSELTMKPSSAYRQGPFFTNLLKTVLSEFEVFSKSPHRIGSNIILQAFKDEFVESTDKLEILNFISQNTHLLPVILEHSTTVGVRFFGKLTEPSEKLLQSQEAEARFFEAIKELFENFIMEIQEIDSEDLNHLVLSIFKRSVSKFPREINDEYCSLFTQDMVERKPFLQKFIWVLVGNCSEEQADILQEKYKLKQSSE